MKQTINNILWWLIVLVTLIGRAGAQTCSVQTQGYASGSGSTGRGSVDVHWTTTTPASQIREFRVFAGWAANLPSAGYFNVGNALHCSLQYVCPINGGPVTIQEIRTDGGGCSVSYTGNLPHGGCSGGNLASLAIANAANFRDAQTDDAIAALMSGVDMTNGGTAFGSTIPLPQSLLGVHVYVGNYEAGLFYVSPLQINFWIPAGVPQGVQQVRVVTANDNALFGTVNIQPNGPGIFTQSSNGQGVAASVWLVSRQNGTQTYYGPGGLPALSATDRVFFILYGTSIKGDTSTLYLGNGHSYDSSYTGPTVFPGLKQMNYPIPVGEVWRSTLGAFVRVWNGSHANGAWDSQGFDTR